MRLRLTFSKTGTLRYIGHLDLQTVLERTIRRAGLPLAYSQGFHPGPRIQIAAALPLGYAGLAELGDIWLETDPGDLAGMQERLQAGSPPGLIIVAVESVDEHAPALQTLVVSTEYAVTFLDPLNLDRLKLEVENLLAAHTLPRVRRGKRYDLRPLIETLSVILPEPVEAAETALSGVKLLMRLSARPGATGRPEEVLAALGLPFESARIERLRLILKTEGE
jgi:radical SAM-linked protein